MTNVLITGGCGFIGSHFIEHFLRNTDWNIVSLDRLDTSGNPNRLASMECWPQERKRVKVLYWDLKSPLNSQIQAHVGEVDKIFHLAAGTHVDRSITDPLSFVMDNVVGTTNLLEYAKVARPEMFYYFSTDEVFGPAPDGVAYKEWDRYNSGNPYSASKAGAEEMCLAYRNTYKLPIRVTHCMNVFGERQHPEKFVPMCINKVLKGETISIHSNKEKTRAGSRFYIHARNVASAIGFLDKSGTDEVKFNIVGEREVSNLEMAQGIAKILDKTLHYEMVDFHSSRPGHDLRYALDGELMKNLGWQYPMTFEESLSRMVNWTINHSEWLKG